MAVGDKLYVDVHQLPKQVWQVFVIGASEKMVIILKNAIVLVMHAMDLPETTYRKLCSAQ